MGCCSNRMDWDGVVDTYTSFQLKLGFQNISCTEYTQLMIQFTKESYQMKRQELGQYFRSQEFGKKMLQGLDTQINKVMSYDKFDYNGDYDCSYVFLLGILYSKGNSKQKASCIYQFFDRKNQGELPRDHIKQVFKFFFEVSLIVIPAIFENKSFEQYKSTQKRSIQKLEEKAINFFGKGIQKIKKLDFENKMTIDLKMIFQPGLIRKQAKKTNPPPTPM